MEADTNYEIPPLREKSWERFGNHPLNMVLRKHTHTTFINGSLQFKCMLIAFLKMLTVDNSNNREYLKSNRKVLLWPLTAELANFFQNIVLCVTALCAEF